MFILGKTSMARLTEGPGVHPLLIACVALALRNYSAIDFGVARDAVRTRLRQRKLVDAGVSWTMDSDHLPQNDGYSHAVDLYPVGYSKMDEVRRSIAFLQIAEAMAMAEMDLGLSLDQGINWEKKDSPHHAIKTIL